MSASCILDWSRAQIAGRGNRVALKPINSTGNLRDELPPLDDTRVWTAVAMKGASSNVVVKEVKLCNRQLEVFPMGYV